MKDNELKKRISELFPQLVEMRRDFHKHPELGFEEIRTNSKICEYLKAWNIDYVSGIAKTGVIATIYGEKSGEGKVVGIRADIDAIPATEENCINYKSENIGVMHACGHDAHMTMLLAAGKVLYDTKETWSGCVKLFFQPAEESDGGAKPMIEQGCLKNPDVDYTIGLHVMPHIETGQVELKYNQLNASSDKILISIKGKSAHGAYPDQGIDAISISGQIITGLQSIVSRNVSPVDSLVITIGTIEGGTKYNNIADQVYMTGTLRATNEATRAFAKVRIKELVEMITKANGGSARVEIEEGYPTLVNDHDVVKVIEEVCKESLGENNIVYKAAPSLGVDDFAYFTQSGKAAYYHLGCGNISEGISEGLHNVNFNIDEECLKVGALIHVKTTLKLLGNESF